MAVGLIMKTISCDGETIPAGTAASYTTAGSGVEKHAIGGDAPVDFPAGLDGVASWGAVNSTITVDSGHGLLPADKVGVFSTSGGFGYRIGLLVTATGTSTVTVTNTAGSGDALPTTSTADVVVSKAVSLTDLSFDGDEMNMLVVNCDQPAVVDFLTAAGASVVSTAASGAVAGIQIDTANIPFAWIDSSPDLRPVTGTAAASADCYNGTNTAASLLIKAILNT